MGLLASRMACKTTAGGVCPFRDRPQQRRYAAPSTSHLPQSYHHTTAVALRHGAAPGFEAGELLSSPATLGMRDLMGLLFGGAA